MVASSSPSTSTAGRVAPRTTTSCTPWVPATVVAAAQEVAGDAATSWDRALALQNWFRTSGGFVYSEEAPVEGGYDGSGLDVLGEFLDQRSGYCVHFASAMAVMSRLLGIPARVAVGFQPGTPETLDDGTVRWTVTTHDLHAWPELYFEGVGWLRFEPTPRIWFIGAC